MIADRLSRATGPTVFILPMQGWSAYDQRAAIASRERGLGGRARRRPHLGARSGAPDWSRKSSLMRAVLGERVDRANDNLDVITVDMHILDPEFADLATRAMGDMLDGTWRKGSTATSRASSPDATTTSAASGRGHQRQQHPARDDARDLAGRVGAHRVHQQEVLVVLLQRHRWTTRAAIGNALMPAAPISGLNLPPVSTLSSLPKTRPAVVSSPKARMPSARMTSVWRLRNYCADHRGADGEPQEERHDVGDLVARTSSSAVDDARLAHQVAEHQRADQRAGERQRCPTTRVTTSGKRMRVRLLTVRSP